MITQGLGTSGPDAPQPRGAARRVLATIAFALLLVCLWASTHRYEGIQGDAALYAFQGLAQLHPDLRSDLFLRSTSQDAYTLFSPIYAACVHLLGLRASALLLMIAFKVWFFAAAASAARAFVGRYLTVLTLAILIIGPASYGAYGVFHYGEDWTTSRSMAEALVLTALALSLHGYRRTGFAFGGMSLLVHPIIGFPGVLLLLMLSGKPRAAALGLAVIILAALAVALGAWLPSPHARWSTPLDGTWLDMVRERSQFLFLQLWRPSDWAQNVRPLLALSFGAMTLERASARKLCVAAAAIGGVGLAVGWTASSIGPASLLLQGQAWRWIWMSEVVALLVLIPTIAAALSARPVGWACAALLIAAWMLTAPWGVFALAGAILLWSMRSKMETGTGMPVAVAIGTSAAVLAYAAYASVITDYHSLAAAHGHHGWKASLRVGIVGFGLITAIAWAIERMRSVAALLAVCVSLAGLTLLILPRSLRDSGVDGTPAALAEFSEWRAIVPPGSNVFVAPSYNSAAFAWFTLERPSYLSVDQSSGIVFSRATALEVQRRTRILLPVMDPDWQILSQLRASGRAGPARGMRPITTATLEQICRDPQLDFVVSRVDVSPAPSGIKKYPHRVPGARHDWNLYDCRMLHAPRPP